MKSFGQIYFNKDEVSALVAPRLAARDDAIAVLSAQIKKLGENPDALLSKEQSQ